MTEHREHCDMANIPESWKRDHHCQCGHRENEHTNTDGCLNYRCDCLALTVERRTGEQRVEEPLRADLEADRRTTNRRQDND